MLKKHKKSKIVKKIKIKIYQIKIKIILTINYLNKLFAIYKASL